MRPRLPTALLIACAISGCTPLRGLDLPEDAARDARAMDSGAPDAPPTFADASPDSGARGDGGLGLDARSPDAPSPVDARAVGADGWAAPDAHVLPDAYLPPPDAHVEPERPTRAGQLVISEIMVTPRRDPLEEWFEVYNPSDSTTYRLAGCALGGLTSEFPLARDLVIPPRTYVTLAPRPSVGFTPDYVYSEFSFSFSPSRDRVAIVCAGNIIDEVVYDGAFPIENERSILVPYVVLSGPRPDLANDAPSAWCRADDSLGYDFDRNFGSPGAPNLCR